MSVVNVAVIGGSTLIGAYSSNKAADKTNKALKEGADAAAEATIQTTEMQLKEIKRQFDYQQQVLLPRIEQQYGAMDMFSDLLGIRPATGHVPSPTGSQQNVVGPQQLPAPDQPSTTPTPSVPPPSVPQSSRNAIIGATNPFIGTPHPAAGALALQSQRSYVTPLPGDVRAEDELQNALQPTDSEPLDIPRSINGIPLPRRFGEHLAQQVRDSKQQPQPTDSEPLNIPRSINGIPLPRRFGEHLAQQVRDSKQQPQPTAMPAASADRTPTPIRPSNFQTPTTRARASQTINRGAQGQFIDPNLDPTQLADTETLSQTVRDNLLAGTSMEDDPLRNYIQGNRVAAPTIEDDLRFNRARDVTAASGAAGTGVYGEEFETSPGYSFAVEEMERQLDRVNSRGGNYGGRAILEAQRRAQGLANQEFYNWAAGRTRDLERRADAERFDISRGDRAVDSFEGQRVADIERMDSATLNYLQRRAGDASRLDTAASARDRLAAVDRQRSDQAYYNYLSNVARAAGMGDAVSQAVGVSGDTSRQIANAYGNQGAQLSSTYGNLGRGLAASEYDRSANINNAIQSGLGNYITYRGQKTAKAA